MAAKGGTVGVAENLAVFDHVLADTRCGCGSVCGRGMEVAESGAVGGCGDDGGDGDSGDRADGDGWSCVDGGGDGDGGDRWSGGDGT